MGYFKDLGSVHGPACGGQLVVAAGMQSLLQTSPVRAPAMFGCSCLHIGGDEQLRPDSAVSYVAALDAVGAVEAGLCYTTSGMNLERESLQSRK
jgi:hypothetical protein